ncbi:hypothetical protein SNOD_28180 [Streptomyces nodosus]|uniref:Uncharacterized protein n=1 Tax=Streptomyces nodosus TaxID=40318 RepID=A0A0B5DS90_9ACTN|nr:hypothetical protein SNOD_28180 [Streptomyces nodosus]
MPISSTQGPSDIDTYTLSTRIRNASTSMSNRAPSAVAVPVRRATLPSTPSRISATAVSPTNKVTGGALSKESATSAVTPPTRIDRPSVTRLAGPKEGSRERSTARVRTAQVPSANASPVSQPAVPIPITAPSKASSSTCTPAPTVVSCCNSRTSYVWFRATAHPPAE